MEVGTKVLAVSASIRKLGVGTVTAKFKNFEDVVAVRGANMRAWLNMQKVKPTTEELKREWVAVTIDPPKGKTRTGWGAYLTSVCKVELAS